MVCLMRIIYLTQTEQKAVELIADGRSMEFIHNECVEAPQRLSNFLATLRRKTGISDTKRALPAQKYLAACHAAINGPRPSPDEMGALATVAAHGIRKLPTEQLTLFKSACQKAAIFTHDNSEARQQCRAYLLCHTSPPDAPKLTPLHKRALRLYTMGKEVWEIADTLADGMQEQRTTAEKLLREGIESLGVISRGRGVQRRLVAIALERMKTLQIDPLDDY